MIRIRGEVDHALQAVEEALQRYDEQHPSAEIVVYRYSSVSIRIRIVDADFAGIDAGDRFDTVWSFLEHLPEDVQSEISLVLLLTPHEVSRSFANQEFEDPVPSRL
ncbi:MAG: hypothetical protein KY476_07310 [Planctomycetes bacterium]|nr:hypothetical protein [Planctomycetota bacterium]